MEGAGAKGSKAKTPSAGVSKAVYGPAASAKSRRVKSSLASNAMKTIQSASTADDFADIFANFGFMSESRAPPASQPAMSQPVAKSNPAPTSIKKGDLIARSKYINESHSNARATLAAAEDLVKKSVVALQENIQLYNAIRARLPNMASSLPTNEVQYLQQFANTRFTLEAPTLAPIPESMEGGKKNKGRKKKST